MRCLKTTWFCPTVQWHEEMKGLIDESLMGKGRAKEVDGAIANLGHLREDQHPVLPFRYPISLGQTNGHWPCAESLDQAFEILAG